MVWLIGEADFIMDKFKLGSKTTSLHCPLLYPQNTAVQA